MRIRAPPPTAKIVAPSGDNDAPSSGTPSATGSGLPLGKSHAASPSPSTAPFGDTMTPSAGSTRSMRASARTYRPTAGTPAGQSVPFQRSHRSVDGSFSTAAKTAIRSGMERSGGGGRCGAGAAGSRGGGSEARGGTPQDDAARRSAAFTHPRAPPLLRGFSVTPPV
jgi:hypothetical protein